MNLEGVPTPLPDARSFILAGNATFTVLNTATGNRFTYRVQQCDTKPGLSFVAVLNGPDNERDYTYLGILRGACYTYGRKSRIAEDAQSARVFAWLWAHLDRLPACITLYHAGRCGRCNRLLST